MSFLIANFLGLFSIINPLGAVPIFIGLTSSKDKKEIQETAFKASVMCFFVLLVSFLVGKLILDFFSISLLALKFSGGAIIAISGFSLLLGQSSIKSEDVDDPTITPLAIPMLAGPGAISFLVSLNAQTHTLINLLGIVFVILVCSVIVFFTLRYSFLLNRLFGESGLKGISKIIGFLVISIGIQYFLVGISEFKNL